MIKSDNMSLTKEQIQEIIEKLKVGKIKLREVEDFAGNDSNVATDIRRKFLEKKEEVE